MYIKILVYKSVYVNSIAISCKPIPQHNFVKYVLFCKKCLVIKKDHKHIYVNFIQIINKKFNFL